MNIVERFTQKEIELIKQAGIKIEDREYSKEEMKRYAADLEEYILSHSSKGNKIDKLNNQYATIFSTINRM